MLIIINIIITIIKCFPYLVALNILYVVILYMLLVLFI